MNVSLFFSLYRIVKISSLLSLSKILNDAKQATFCVVYSVVFRREEKKKVEEAGKICFPLIR